MYQCYIHISYLFSIMMSLNNILNKDENGILKKDKLIHNEPKFSFDYLNNFIATKTDMIEIKIDRQLEEWDKEWDKEIKKEIKKKGMRERDSSTKLDNNDMLQWSDFYLANKNLFNV